MKGLNYVCKETLLTTFTSRDTLRKPESVICFLKRKEKEPSSGFTSHAECTLIIECRPVK